MANDHVLLLVSFSLVGLLFLLFILIFKTPNSKEYYISSKMNLDPALQKLVKIFGPDILSITPESIVKKQSSSNEIELLIRKAGNPWKITPAEFFIIRFTLSGIGLLFGIGIGIFLSFAFKTSLVIIPSIIFMCFMGWIYPSAHYSKLANERESQFQKSLPEAIDLLNMALKGGSYTLPNAIEEVISLMEKSPIREEFIQITQDIQSGMSVEESLNNFADRAPTPGIQAFVKALNNANKLSVEMTTILEARAKVSRKELKALAERRISTLAVRIMLVLSPASAFAITGVAIVPSLVTLSRFF